MPTFLKEWMISNNQTPSHIAKLGNVSLPSAHNHINGAIPREAIAEYYYNSSGAINPINLNGLDPAVYDRQVAGRIMMSIARQYDMHITIIEKPNDNDPEDKDKKR